VSVSMAMLHVSRRTNRHPRRRRPSREVGSTNRTGSVHSSVFQYPDGRSFETRGTMRQLERAPKALRRSCWIAAYRILRRSAEQGLPITQT
jgi:hypothetical protein